MVYIVNGQNKYLKPARTERKKSGLNETTKFKLFQKQR